MWYNMIHVGAIAVTTTIGENNMATYTKQANGITTAISIERAADDRYISIQIRSHKGLEIIEGAHIWIPVTEFQKFCEAAIKEAEQSA